MNSENTSESPKSLYDVTPEDVEFLASLDRLGADVADDDNDEEDDADEDSRFVTIHLPVAAVEEYGWGSLGVPIRSILAMVADEFDGQGEHKDAIWARWARDEFYAGDHEYDLYSHIEPPTFLPREVSAFEVAQREVDRALARDRRLAKLEAKRAKDQVDFEKRRRELAAAKEPFAAEYAALEAQEHDRLGRWKALRSEARAFVRAAYADDNRDERLAEGAREFGKREEQLKLEHKQWDQRCVELDDRRWAASKANGSNA